MLAKSKVDNHLDKHKSERETFYRNVAMLGTFGGGIGGAIIPYILKIIGIG